MTNKKEKAGKDITQQLMPIYKITKHDNKCNNIAFNVAKTVGAIRHQHATRAARKKKKRYFWNF